MLVRSVAAALLVAVCLGACRSSEKAACGKPFAEPIDQNSSIHILPGQPDLPYKTNPPTSGAHRVAEIPTGTQLQPIPKPEQVNILESGRILIQYKDLKALQVAEVQRLQGDDVIVAPNSTLDAPIVATAWLFKMQCTSVDATALNRFVKAHAEQHEGH